ncbi:hypothetical protein B0H16DRAFT_1524135 [Mycena metata]|uniref:CCHC-type domain-containing protein n=1 Tax=Mycena metata TaxID=1033252 RepID=A0AAD7JKA5_9AGAR|nr:hypothetical protein B0H16DRAFT_1524135 [Mycena metata]
MQDINQDRSQKTVPRTKEEPGHIASGLTPSANSTLPTNGNPSSGVKKRACHSCGRLGHMNRNCPQKKCYNCSRQVLFSPFQNQTAYTFLRQGHISRDCPKPQTCHQCHSPDHISVECSIFSAIVIECRANIHSREIPDDM